MGIRRVTLPRLLLLTAALLAPLPAHAATIALLPPSETVFTGGAVSISVAISGLEPGSLGVFDIDVAFDPAVLGFVEAVYGDPALGDQLDVFGLGSLTQTTVGSGTVNLFGLSFDLATDLDAFQADSFTLAVLTFSTLASGTSPLTLTPLQLGLANGDPLAADVDSTVVTVRSTPGTTAPEPALLLLAGCGLAAFVARRRSRRSLPTARSDI